MYLYDDFDYHHYSPPAPKVNRLEALPAPPADEAVAAWAERHKISDAAVIDAARQLAERQHRHLRYFAAGPEDIIGPVCQALIVAWKSEYNEGVSYRLALKFRDGRIALASARYHPRKDGGDGETEFSEALIAKRCRRLLEEVLGIPDDKPGYERYDKSFTLDSRSVGMKFPDDPDYWSPRDFRDWSLPRDLGKHSLRNDYTDIYDGPETDVFKTNIEQNLSTAIFGGVDKYAPLKKIEEDRKGFYRPESMQDLRETILNLERGRFQEAWKGFSATLDPEVLGACRELGIVSAAAYNWLSGGPVIPYAPDGGRKDWRLQAAKAFPLFFRELGNAEVTKAIDTAQPLAPVLAKHLGPSYHDKDSPYAKELRPATVQRLQAQFGVEDLKHMPIDRASGYHWVRFEALPPEWWPKTQADLDAYKNLVDAAEKYRQIFDMQPLEILRGFRGQWQAACDRLKDPQDRYVSFSNRQRDCEDYLNALHRKLYLPAILTRAAERGLAVEDWWAEKPVHDGKRKLISGLFNGLSLGNRVELSERWHDRLTTINARLAELGLAKDVQQEIRSNPSGVTWAPLSAPQTAPNGLRLVPLNSKSELEAEGDVMGHCVGGYSAECLSGKDFIVSLRDAAGKHLSTLHLRLSGSSLYTVQHRGPHNHEIGAKEQAAADWYLKGIGDKSISSIVGATVAQRKQAELAAAAAAIVGFDPFDAENRRKAFEIHKPYLPKRQRDMDYETWAKDIKLVESVETFLDTVAARQKQQPRP
jgi:hypothetical protein